MTPEQFCYWLQGYLEITTADERPQHPGLTENQRRMISDHLDTVFTKVTPDRKKEKVLLSEKKTQGQKFQDVIDELQRSRPDTTCNPFDPYPGMGTKRIC